MRVAIFAGGFGTRLSEETVLKPKPMVEIGGKPILWHIMKIYSHFGFNDFVIALGYKGHMIKEWFANYFLYNSDITIHLRKNEIEVHSTYAEDWRITLIDTGLRTNTGGRLAKLKPYLDEGTFMLTYGDGLADINLKALLAFHKAHGKLATLTAVQPEGRFGTLSLEGEKVLSFVEKPPGDGAWVNGGFFVLQPEVFDFIQGDEMWEATLARIAEHGQLMAYRHKGFWKCMDTLRDKNKLEALWQSGKAPWALWGRC